MSTIKATTLEATTLLHSDGTSTTEPSIPALDKRFAKAFIRWNMATASTGTLNGTGDVYGFSSITDTALGNQLITFTTAMPNANYVALITGNATTTWQGAETAVIGASTTQVHAYHVENAATKDATLVSLVVFAN